MSEEKKFCVIHLNNETNMGEYQASYWKMTRDEVDKLFDVTWKLDLPKFQTWIAVRPVVGVAWGFETRKEAEEYIKQIHIEKLTGEYEENEEVNEVEE